VSSLRIGTPFDSPMSFRKTAKPFATMIVHSVLTHHPAAVADGMVAFLSTLGPDVKFCLAYGGTEEEFEKIRFSAKFFLNDPSLRGRIEEQNFASWLTSTVAWCKQSGLRPELVHFTENDHLPLRADYWRELERASIRSDTDFLGKWCMDRTNTNEQFYLHYRDHEQLRHHLASVSVHSDKRTIWGALADGMLFRWAALESLTRINLDVPCFTEILIPSTLHHLGFTLADFDAYSSIYRFVRHRPAWEITDVSELVSQGAWCCHPFKCIAQLNDLYQLVPGQ